MDGKIRLSDGEWTLMRELWKGPTSVGALVKFLVPVRCESQDNTIVNIPFGDGSPVSSFVFYSFSSPPYIKRIFSFINSDRSAYDALMSG